MLSGIRVIELGTVITAPLAAMMLADLGADVIKIERPTGDPFRWARGNGYGPSFVAYNRNKRSVVLDLSLARNRELLLDLVKTSDVLLDNFRPGVLSRLGLDPTELRRLNPRLVQCSITGFGERGPYAERPAFDAVAQAISGMSSLFVDAAEPESVGPTISDNATGMYAAYAILAALFERQSTGQGKRLAINMLEASMAFMPDAFANLTQGKMEVDRYTRSSSSQSFALRCSDGAMIAIHLSTQEKFWKALIAAIEAPELGADSRFAERAGRVDNYRELQEELRAHFVRRPLSEWKRRLAGVDVPYAPINSLGDALVDPQVAALDTVYRVDHPALGTWTGIHCPVLADGRRPKANIRPAPQLGEHSAEVLGEVADRTSRS
ncbi:MAG: CoA transferase [Hyphomicrobiales bacterium]|nr:CoA transferase [Hyphomicrobiales bacterium]